MTKIKKEWVWVEGYKGTDKDMRCKNDFQYELGKTFDMPEKDVKMCESGFHFCECLRDVFGYYPVGNGNRFFKVRALVLKDVEETNTKDSPGTALDNAFAQLRASTLSFGNRDKQVAKSIQFISEVSIDEIFSSFNTTVYSSWSDEYKRMALEQSIRFVEEHIAELEREEDVKKLITQGYSSDLATYIVHERRSLVAKAYALGSQTNISMDTRVLALFSNGNGD